jgi:DNA-binding response OmpR family regulator
MKRIMVVENCEEISSYFKEILEEQNYEVRVFSDAFEAIKEIGASERYEALVVDRALGVGIFGKDLARLFKDKQRGLVIMISGLAPFKNSTERKAYLESSGIDAFFYKPLDEEKFLEFIRKRLDSNHAQTRT